MAKAQPLLDDTLRAALAAKVDVRELLEVVLQCLVYGGHVTVEPAIQTFHAIANEHGLLGHIKQTQLPLNGTDDQRDRAREQKSWHKNDMADPRTQPLLDKHGWRAVGRGLTMRPHHHINILDWIDRMDSEFAGLWVRFCYGDMYSRGVLDDKTRLLCMIGDCLAVGMRLGCLNHALLTAEAIRSRGLRLAGWVANHIDAAMPRADENVAALQSRLAAPLLARIAPDPDDVALAVRELRVQRDLGVVPEALEHLGVVAGEDPSLERREGDLVARPVVDRAEARVVARVQVAVVDREVRPVEEDAERLGRERLVVRGQQALRLLQEALRPLGLGILRGLRQVEVRGRDEEVEGGIVGDRRTDHHTDGTEQDLQRARARHLVRGHLRRDPACQVQPRRGRHRGRTPGLGSSTRRGRRWLAPSAGPPYN